MTGIITKIAKNIDNPRYVKMIKSYGHLMEEGDKTILLNEDAYLSDPLYGVVNNIFQVYNGKAKKETLRFSKELSDIIDSNVGLFLYDTPELIQKRKMTRDQYDTLSKIFLDKDLDGNEIKYLNNKVKCMLLENLANEYYISKGIEEPTERASPKPYADRIFPEEKIKSMTEEDKNRNFVDILIDDSIGLDRSVLEYYASHQKNLLQKVNPNRAKESLLYIHDIFKQAYTAKGIAVKDQSLVDMIRMNSLYANKNINSFVVSIIDMGKYHTDHIDRNIEILNKKNIDITTAALSNIGVGKSAWKKEYKGL